MRPKGEKQRRKGHSALDTIIPTVSIRHLYFLLNSLSLSHSLCPSLCLSLSLCLQGGLHEFISLHTFHTQLEYDIMTLFADTNTLAIYKTGGDFSPVTTAYESLGYTETDLWSPQELSSHNSEILFKRGLAKMAVAAMSYRISHLTREVASISNSSNKELRKELRQSIVRLSTKRNCAMNFLRSRTKVDVMSVNFNAQELILRIVAACYNEFLSDVSHPCSKYTDHGDVRDECVSVAMSYTEDSLLLEELLNPPGSNKDKKTRLSFAFVVDEILFSGNM